MACGHGVGAWVWCVSGVGGVGTWVWCGWCRCVGADVVVGISVGVMWALEYSRRCGMCAVGVGVGCVVWGVEKPPEVGRIPAEDTYP